MKKTLLTLIVLLISNLSNPVFSQILPDPGEDPDISPAAQINNSEYVLFLFLACLIYFFVKFKINLLRDNNEKSNK